MPVLSLTEWDAFLSQYPDVHLLQTPAWGELKNVFGWQAIPVQSGQAGALMLFRRLPLGLTLAYIPKGPVGSGWKQLWPEVDRLCKSKNAFMLKVELDTWEGHLPAGEEIPAKWLSETASVQPRRTIIIDICGDEEAILARMKQKTRYNIHLAQRKGVTVRACDDLQAFYHLMEVTGKRDGFGVHSQAYYQRVFDLFTPNHKAVMLVAEYDQRPLAALMAFRQGRRAWYFYGASNDEERNRMPTYLLQWEAMRWAKSHACLEYDLWGVPDDDHDILEAGFETRSDGLWGVYRFKRGFGGQLRRSQCAYDCVYQTALYRLYLWWSRRGKVEG